jgi:hypothetical protein
MIFILSKIFNSVNQNLTNNPKLIIKKKEAILLIFINK